MKWHLDVFVPELCTHTHWTTDLWYFCKARHFYFWCWVTIHSGFVLISFCSHYSSALACDTPYVCSQLWKYLGLESVWWIWRVCFVACAIFKAFVGGCGVFHRELTFVSQSEGVQISHSLACTIQCGADTDTVHIVYSCVTYSAVKKTIRWQCIAPDSWMTSLLPTMPVIRRAE